MGKEIRHSQKTWLPLDDTSFEYYLQMCKMYDTLKKMKTLGVGIQTPPPMTAGVKHYLYIYHMNTLLSIKIEDRSQSQISINVHKIFSKILLV